MLSDILEHINDQQPAALQRLCDYLSIPSVSTDPAYSGDVQRCAEWTRDRLAESGLTAEVLPTAGHPVVLARTPDPKPDQPTVLFYGHYDVQPPDPLDLWTTPPFQPEIRDDKIYARGACDDKGQVSCFLEALRATHTVAGDFPINITVLIEGEEECGSDNLEPFIEQHKDRLQADIAVVSDTAMWDDGTPAITYALRGITYFDLKLHGPSRDLHSGVFGGTVPNPATQLINVLGQLLDDNHHVTVPGFYDDVIPTTPDEAAEWDNLTFSDEAWAKEAGVSELLGEQGFTTLQRRWARPSCDVNGIYGGYMGEGAKTVIPSFAGAKVSFRLAANQDPEKINAAFTRWLHDHTPPGCTWEITHHGSAHPVAVATDSPYMAAAKRAMHLGTDTEPVLVRDGATIPVIATFKNLLGLDTLLMGFGRTDDNIHSPNEKFDLSGLLAGTRSHAALIHGLANL